MLGVEKELEWQPYETGGLDIMMPQLNINQLPSTHAWVIKLTDLK